MNPHTHYSLETSIDPSTLRRTFACFPTGVAAVCADSEEGPVGLLVSSFTSVSLDPPLVSICIMNGSHRWSLLRTSKRLGVSFLGDEQQHICTQLSGSRSHGLDTLATSRTDEGAVMLHDATAWLDCSLHKEVDAGDHTIALLRIEGLETSTGHAPLVFHNSQFHRLAAL